MNPIRTTAITLALLAAVPAYALPFGGGDKVKVKVLAGAPFKEGNKFALGAFRVTFIEEDEVVSMAKGSWVTGGSASSSTMTGSLSGVDHALMQKIADEVYADFLKQATAKGLTMVDSKTLASTSATYKALATTPNFEQGRMGTVVIPTGQQSVPLAEDRSEKANKGSKGLMAQWKQMGATDFASADANKAFPVAAKESGMPVIGVTIVVNFADFKGGAGSFGNSKVGMNVGATIEGNGKTEMLRATSIVGWTAKTPNCTNCFGQMLLDGTVHSTAPIGATEASKAKKKISSMTLDALNGPSMSRSKKTVTVEVDPDAYEQHVLEVAAQASAMLVSELGSR